jgi:hypothetical protein
MIKNASSFSTPGQGLCRREFLILSGICAAATVALGPKLFAAGVAPHGLAVGAAPIDEVNRVHTDPFETTLSAASGITSSDGAFLRRGVRVGLAGFALGTAARRTIAFRSHYATDDENIAVQTWAYVRATGQAGGPASFVMPIDVEQRLRFTLEIADAKVPQQGDAGDASTNVIEPIVFSLLNEPDVIKLTRAYYAIVPILDGKPEPSWSSYALLRHKGHMLLHEMRDGFAQPVEREHFVLRFEYGTPGF